MPANSSAIMNMKKIASGRYGELTNRNPAIRQITKTTSPCANATIAPPSIRPKTISSRETGATSVSFKNPNCRSQIISMPENTALKRIAIETIPGERKLM